MGCYCSFSSSPCFQGKSNWSLLPLLLWRSFWLSQYVNYHGNVSIGSPHVLRESLFEMREYLFGIGCLFYSLELMLAQGRFAAISRVPFTGLKLRGRRIHSG